MQFITLKMQVIKAYKNYYLVPTRSVPTKHSVESKPD